MHYRLRYNSLTAGTHESIQADPIMILMLILINTNIFKLRKAPWLWHHTQWYIRPIRTLWVPEWLAGLFLCFTAWGGLVSSWLRRCSLCWFQWRGRLLLCPFWWWYAPYWNIQCQLKLLVNRCHRYQCFIDLESGYDDSMEAADAEKEPGLSLDEGFDGIDGITRRMNEHERR